MCKMNLLLTSSSETSSNLNIDRNTCCVVTTPNYGCLANGPHSLPIVSTHEVPAWYLPFSGCLNRYPEIQKAFLDGYTIFNRC